MPIFTERGFASLNDLHHRLSNPQELADQRAVCGRTARTVRRPGGTEPNRSSRSLPLVVAAGRFGKNDPFPLVLARSEAYTWSAAKNKT